MTTRQQIEEVLAEFEGERISDALINDICSAIFRPPFQPKRGQVCMFGESKDAMVILETYIEMFDGEYMTLGGDVFKYGRPLNSEELGE